MQTGCNNFTFLHTSQCTVLNEWAEASIPCGFVTQSLDVCLVQTEAQAFVDWYWKNY
jgi:hypothetical protein